MSSQNVLYRFLDIIYSEFTFLFKESLNIGIRKSLGSDKSRKDKSGLLSSGLSISSDLKSALKRNLSEIDLDRRVVLWMDDFLSGIALPWDVEIDAFLLVVDDTSASVDLSAHDCANRFYLKIFIKCNLFITRTSSRNA